MSRQKLGVDRTLQYSNPVNLLLILVTILRDEKVLSLQFKAVMSRLENFEGLKGQCHEEFAVLGQFWAKIITWRL